MDQAQYFRLFEQASSAASRGDFTFATSAANQFLARDPEDPNAYQLLGLCFSRQGRTSEALTAYLKADKGAPNHPPILNSLGALYKRIGDLEKAKDFAARASKSSPNFAEAHLTLAAVLDALEDSEGAHAAFKRAIAATPKHPDAFAKYAVFLDKEHDLETAHIMAMEALKLNSAHPIAHLTMAELDAREDRHDAIVDRLSSLKNTPIPEPQIRALILSRLAKSLEKKERYEEAFGAFSAANEAIRGYNAASIAHDNSSGSTKNVRRLHAFFEKTNSTDWTQHSFERTDPTFLVGFPRSGTTLLGQILSSHPNITVLEEKSILVDAETKFILETDQLEKLPALDRSVIKKYRDAYFKRRDTYTKDSADIVIDKMPLNIALLGFIHRFFPNAKFIFALRDPRDAVLSCFQQTFAANAAMFQFLSLETAADYYNDVMSLSDIYRDKFPIQIHEVRYENLVTDLNAEIEPLLQFLNVSWDERLLSYHEHAKKSVIRTPSAKQVIQKPYTSSVEKWRRYEGKMNAVLPQLNQWVKRFGYAEDSA